MTPSTSWQGLAAFGLDLEFEAKGRGNGFAGPAWRGLLGHALAKRVCIRDTPSCTGCPLTGQCAYPLLFKPLDATALAPFWLHGWNRHPKGWRVGIRWLGEGAFAHMLEWLEALSSKDPARTFGGQPARLVRAFDVASTAEIWNGKQGAKASARPIMLVGGAPPPQACRVRTITPLLSKHAGDPLFGALATRVQRLVLGFGSGETLPRPAIPWKLRILERRACPIPLDRRVLAAEEFLLELSELDPFSWELLQAGQELHAGGQTALGCGRYRIETLAADST